MTELKRPLRGGKIALVLAADPVGDPAHLRVELFDANGNAYGAFQFQRQMSATRQRGRLRSHQIEAEQRKVQYLRQYPLRAETTTERASSSSSMRTLAIGTSGSDAIAFGTKASQRPTSGSGGVIDN